MAFTNLSVNTTLGTVKANIRSQTGTLNPQETQLVELQLNDIVHNSVLFVRGVLGKLVDDFYSTSETVTESSNLIDVSAKEIADVNKTILYDATHGKIPFVSNSVFYLMQTLYTSTLLANTTLATVSNILATDNKLQIRTFRGTSKTTPGTLTLVYPRMPKKTTVDATKIDVPDIYVPVVQDAGTVYVLQKFEKQIDPDLRSRLQVQLGSAVAQLGIKVEPEAA